MRCSLENFGCIEFTDNNDDVYPEIKKQIQIHPLYSLSTL